MRLSESRQQQSEQEVQSEIDAHVANQNLLAGQKALQAENNELSARIRELEDNTLEQVARNDGDMILVLERAKDPGETITAAELNAAPAGTVKRTIKVTMETVDSEEIHDWLSQLTPLLTTAITTVGTAAAPTITGTPTFKNGELSVEITFDTNGTTIVYLAAEFATLKVQTRADDKFSGWPVDPSGGVLKTITVN